MRPTANLDAIKSFLEMKKGSQASLGVDHALDAPRPCAVKINPIDMGKNIDRHWFPAKTDEFARLQKIVNGNASNGGAKSCQRCIHRTGILWIGFDE